jgi:hypothetical protein
MRGAQPRRFCIKMQSRIERATEQLIARERFAYSTHLPEAERKARMAAARKLKKDVEAGAFTDDLDGLALAILQSKNSCGVLDKLRRDTEARMVELAVICLRRNSSPASKASACSAWPSLSVRLAISATTPPGHISRKGLASRSLKTVCRRATVPGFCTCRPPVWRK